MPIHMRKNGLKVQNSDGTWVNAGGVASTATEEDVIKNKNDIANMKDESSGILAQAKSYVDSILPTASVANAKTLDGKEISDIVLNEDVDHACASRINIPDNVNVADWLRHNARRGISYITTHENKGQTGLPADYSYFAWYTCDGINIFAKTYDNRYFYLWELNAAGYQWRQIQFTDNIDFQVHADELDADGLKEVNPGIFAYNCHHWKNYPSNHIDAQGTIIDVSFGTSGEYHWSTQYFISPHGSGVWKRNFVSGNISEWERITHHFWSGTTTAKSNTLNFKPSMVMVFSGDFVSVTNGTNGFITITDTGFDFASAPDKAYGVYAFA